MAKTTATTVTAAEYDEAGNVISQVITKLLTEVQVNEGMRAAYDALPEGVKAPKASKWARSSSLTWDASYNGYSLSARKIDGQWNVFLWNEMIEDWNTVLVFENAGIRGFWKNTCLWLALSLAEVTNPLTGYVPPAEDAGDEPASQTGLTRAEVAEGIKTVELEQPADPAWADQGDDSEHPTADELEAVTGSALTTELADLCPKCGAYGDAKCQTKTGKAVKDNGGYHTVRPGHASK